MSELKFTEGDPEDLKGIRVALAFLAKRKLKPQDESKCEYFAIRARENEDSNDSNEESE